MTDPTYNPATAFGNKELLKRCPQVEEEKTEDEEEPGTMLDWNAEATEYTLEWTCECGAKNEDLIDYEPTPGDEVDCYKCQKRFTLQ